MKKALLLFFLACSACVTTAQEGDEMRKDIASLRADLKKETDTATADRQKQADEAAGRAKALQDALDQLSRAARKSGADMGVDLEKAQNDLSAVHGQLEVLQHRLDAMEKAQTDQQKANEAAVAAAAQQKKEAEHPTDKTGIYNLGRSKLEAGQTQRARALHRLPGEVSQGRSGLELAVLAGRNVLRGAQVERRHRRAPEGAQGVQ